MSAKKLFRRGASTLKRQKRGSTDTKRKYSEGSSVNVLSSPLGFLADAGDANAKTERMQVHERAGRRLAAERYLSRYRR